MGQVTTVDGPANPEITRVWAVPASEEQIRFDPSRLLERRRETMARLNEQGYFVLRDLRPGRYVVVVHQPGFAVHDRTQVVVAENRETALRDPIVLTPPVGLLVEVMPPLDVFEAPWEVRIFRRGPLNDILERIASGRTDSGRWQAESLESGTYFVDIFDSRQNRWLHEGPVHLDSQEGTETFVPINVDVIEVSGTVRLGDERLAEADVWFGGRNGVSSIETVTDEDGAFEAALPRAGDWKVEIAADQPPVTHAGTIDVPDSGGRVDLELPDTRIAGRVVTEEGDVPRPLPTVRAVRTDDQPGLVPVVVDEDGGFEARGIAEGLYEVQAKNDAGASQIVAMPISEAAEAPELTLVLKRTKTVQGSVMTEHGGLAGARVQAWPFSDAGRILELGIPSVQSEPSGRFQLELPAETTTVLLWIYPPGFGFTPARRPLDALTVQVASAESTLRIPPIRRSESGLVPVVEMNGFLVDVTSLLDWANMNGIAHNLEDESFEIPAVPSGVYRYCLLDPSEIMAVLQGSASPAHCSEGVVAPGSALTLSAP